jgi:hypothetical protein
VGQDGICHAHHAEDIDVEHVTGLTDAALLAGAEGADARIVDEYVNSAEPLHHLGDQGAHGLVVGHVEVEERHPVESSCLRRLATRADHRVSDVN